MESKIKLLAAALMFLSVPSVLSAQKTTKIHDSEKFKQIRSMEDGTWDFGAGMYYWTWHNKYSGAYWKWRVGIPPWKIKYREKDSDVKRTATARAAQIPFELITMDKLNQQIDSIQPLVIEETIRSAERMVDITYGMYEDDFKDYGQKIKKVLTYCLAKGDNGIDEACMHIQMEYETICSSIEYIHEQGPGSEIEPTKRQIAYEDARNRLDDLLKSSIKLMRLADSM